MSETTKETYKAEVRTSFVTLTWSPTSEVRETERRGFWGQRVMSLKLKPRGSAISESYVSPRAKVIH